MGRRRRRLPADPVEARITAMSHEGRGIAHHNDRTVFVDFALPGERVLFRYTKLRRARADAVAETVLEPAAERIAPGCAHFGVCGGCALQHLSPEDQRAHKERVVLELMERVGGVTPERVLPPLTGSVWGYRRRARLGCKYVEKKGGQLVGFREKHSPLITPLQRCPILDPRVGEHLPALAAGIEGLSVPHRIPQVEVACGDDAVVLVLRHLEPLNDADIDVLAALGERYGWSFYLQPGDESTAAPLPTGGGASLTYRLPEFDVELAFRPTDFVQVNAEINRYMVSQAVEWLEPAPGRKILELFCGLGNFSLPLARLGAAVTALEGEKGLVERARSNAAANGLEARFEVADLTRSDAWPVPAAPYDAVLLDPPRTGAAECLEVVARSGASRVVYCSCGPATLARDAGILVREHGFRLTALGIMDMFPHTAHVESFAVFDR